MAFMLHMYILMESIRTLHAKLVARGLQPNIRIGHGIAFLHGYQRFHPATLAPMSSNFPPSEFYQDLALFRDFLRRNEIVCELCPTSNFVLLADSFDSENLSNRSTLKAFEREKLPVVLSTDHEGILHIGKCNCAKQHSSVKHEYCISIKNGDISNLDQLNKMIRLSEEKCFFSIDLQQKDLIENLNELIPNENESIQHDYNRRYENKCCVIC